jgi:hypothetical protein
MITSAKLTRKYNLVSPYLNRRQISLWAAVEAEAENIKGVALVASVTGIPVPTISAWIKVIRTTASAPAGTLTLPKMFRGRGRKFAEVNAPELKAALEDLVTDETAGDPMSEQKWVRSSLRRLSKRLKDQGHQACTHTVARLLRKMGFSLRVNRKKQYGSQNPARDAQFLYIKSLKEQFASSAAPVISVDTKKKELIGDFKREGKTWCKEAPEVDGYFGSNTKCVAVPFGIYDVKRNTGYVVVGISHNTAEFAVNCLLTWWKDEGSSAYPGATEILILADGGGGNGYNLRKWKKDIQDMLCNSFGLTVTVAHYPPGCSKWNPVEYRLFSQISMNWAGKPLRTVQMMLGYIRGTTTTTGLRVSALLDSHTYEIGKRVTKREMTQIKIRVHEVSPAWNYTLIPDTPAGTHHV